jgi:hypothetical protein
MTTLSTLLRTVTGGVLLALAPAYASASTPALVTNLTGTLAIEQKIPCETLHKTTTVAGGSIELSPAFGVDVSGGKLFAATQATIMFAPFSIGGSCYGFGDTRHYTELGIQLPKAVTFTAVPGGGTLYTFTIPADSFQIYEAARFDGNTEQGYKQPSQDVTGSLDLGTGAFQLHAVFATSIHFKEGCVPLAGCVINETDPGTLTADIAGTISLPDADHDGVPDNTDNCVFTANPDQTPVPTPVITPPAPVTLTSCLDHNIGMASGADVCDRTAVSITNYAPSAFHAGLNVVTWTGTDGKGRIGTATQNVTVNDTTPPTVSCTAVGPPQGHSFVVQADDICGEPVIRLGSYVLQDGEQIKIEESGQGGATFINVVDGSRHFHVAKGQAIVTATDSAGNVATAVCR